ncbi:MAG: hypothetical protein ACOC3A_01965 [Thermodesulfobacteriota bacterium]
MAEEPHLDNTLTQLLKMAPAEDLVGLIQQLSTGRPDIRRECFDFLKSHIPIEGELENKPESEMVLALWDELEPELSELNARGGGPYEIENQVADLLVQIKDLLESKKIEDKYREEIRDEVVGYLKSGNAGMDDLLYDIAYASCYNNDDLRCLAEAFESIGGMKMGQAVGIYRRIGDREKYLELRSRKMITGMDYYDLASFYWDSGDKQKALETARRGMAKAVGRMDELRAFLSARAEESGDRESYLALQFAHTMDHLTLGKYQSFENLCTASEWTRFEPKILEQLKTAGWELQLKIYMYRKEYETAVAILTEKRNPSMKWTTEVEMETARYLEEYYPEKILQFYISELGDLNKNRTRKEYAAKANLMAKVRRLWVEVIGEESRWKAFACKVKRDNVRRPAFQEEFAKVIPKWQDLE